MKADERYMASVDGITLAVYAWIAAVFVAVIGATLLFGVSGVDVLGWLADAADTLAGHESAGLSFVAATPRVLMLRFAQMGGELSLKPARLVGEREDGLILVRVWGESSDRVVSTASIVAQGDEA